MFDVFAELLLHGEKGKANSGRAWSSLRPALHQTLVKQRGRQTAEWLWQIWSQTWAIRVTATQLVCPGTALPLLPIIHLQLTKTLTEGCEAYGRHFLVVFSCVWLQCNFNSHFRVSPCRGQVCVLQKAAASVRDAAGERDTNQIKGRLKLRLIWEKCLKACRDHGPEPCHPARVVFEGIWYCTCGWVLLHQPLKYALRFSLERHVSYPLTR